MRAIATIVVVLVLTGGLWAQGPDIESIRADMLAALTGDTERFERGMRAVEALASSDPHNARIKVLYGTGLFARAGTAFQTGGAQNALALLQAALDEMARAVAMAPDDVFVRGRRGVILISASRQTPAAMARPLTQLAVEDFEKVLELRETTSTLAQGSTHQRGELLTGLGDGWSRLGERERARRYFQRITRELQGTIYDQRATAWLDNRPEAQTPAFFTCSGCHVESDR